MPFMEIFSVVIEILAVGPDQFDDVDPFLRVVVAVLMRALLNTEHVELAFVPADHDIEPEAALADVVGGDHFLRRHHRIEDRRMHGTEHSDVLGGAEQPGRPGDRFQRRALIISVAAVALPAPDRQEEIDAGVVRHDRELLVVGPAARPALGHQRHGAAGRAIGAEQADLQFIIAVHGAAGIQRRRRSVHHGHSVLVAISAP